MRFPLYFFFLSSAAIASHSAPAGSHARRALRLRDIGDVVGGVVDAVGGVVNGVVGECFLLVLIFRNDGCSCGDARWWEFVVSGFYTGRWVRSTIGLLRYIIG